MRLAILLSSLVLAAACAPRLAFNDPPSLNDLVRCPARLAPRDTSAAIVFAGQGAPPDSILVRVFGGHRGHKLPIEGAVVVWDSLPGMVPVRWRSSDAAGMAWMFRTSAAAHTLSVRAIALLPVRVALPADVRIDSVHAILQFHTPQVCALREYQPFAAG